MVKYAKYLFPNYEVAMEMLETLNDENCLHEPFGFKAKTENEVATGRYQLDVKLNFLDNEEVKHPIGFEKYVIDLDFEGNNIVGGFSYLKNKLA